MIDPFTRADTIYWKANRTASRAMPLAYGEVATFTRPNRWLTPVAIGLVTVLVSLCVLGMLARG